MQVATGGGSVGFTMEIVANTPRRVASYLQSRFSPEAGAGLVEYVLLVGLIAIVAIVAVRTFGTSVADLHQEVADSLKN
jgi:Flp pilus assembly pilin Flp